MPLPRFLRVRYLKSFQRAVRYLDLSDQSALAAAGVKNFVAADAESWMPVTQLGKFAAAAAQEHGCWDLGLQAALLPREQHSDFSRRSLITPTLYQSLQTIARHAHTEDTSALYRLVPGREATWLNCGRVPGDPETVRQIELFRLGALIEVIRFTAGMDWLPAAVDLQSADERRLSDQDLLRATNCRFNSLSLRIQIPTRVLSQVPDIAGVPPAGEATPSDSALETPLDYALAIREVIRGQLGWQKIKVQDVARIAGVSTRSLQRHFAAYDTSFSNLVEQVRTERAREMLTGTSMKQRDIARELGYRHATHFSRAFRKISGVSPRQYRSMTQCD